MVSREFTGGETAHQSLDIGALGGVEFVGFALLRLQPSAFDPCAQAVFERFTDHIATRERYGGRD